MDETWRGNKIIITLSIYSHSCTPFPYLSTFQVAYIPSASFHLHWHTPPLHNSCKSSFNIHFFDNPHWLLSFLHAGVILSPRTSTFLFPQFSFHPKLSHTLLLLAHSSHKAQNSCNFTTFLSFLLRMTKIHPLLSEVPLHSLQQTQKDIAPQTKPTPLSLSLASTFLVSIFISLI